MGFIGEYNHTVDAKGRVIVPSKFREILGDEFIVTKGLDHCLCAYESTEWEKFEQKLANLPTNSRGKDPAPLRSQDVCPDREGRRAGRQRQPRRDLEQGEMDRGEQLR